MSKVRPEEQAGMELFGQNLFMAAKDLESDEHWIIERIENSHGRKIVYTYTGKLSNAEALARSVGVILRRADDDTAE